MGQLDAESLSSSLDWKQFEELAEVAFRSFGYETVKNYRLKKPRLEIDLLAMKESGRIAFAVDCKHWKRTVGHAAMVGIGEKQIARCEHVVREDERVGRLIPVILTWHDEYLSLLENGVAVVPIQKVSDFILNWESSFDCLCIVERESICQDS